FFRFRLVPQLLAFLYYHVSWMLYVLDPGKSYRLNADFEDHAEHEYMGFVEEHPALEDEAFVSDFRQDYGEFRCVADLLRQIGLDEREHKDESVAKMSQPRFG